MFNFDTIVDDFAATTEQKKTTTKPLDIVRFFIAKYCNETPDTDDCFTGSGFGEDSEETQVEPLNRNAFRGERMFVFLEDVISFHLLGVSPNFLTRTDIRYNYPSFEALYRAAYEAFLNIRQTPWKERSKAESLRQTLLLEFLYASVRCTNRVGSPLRADRSFGDALAAGRAAIDEIYNAGGFAIKGTVIHATADSAVWMKRLIRKHEISCVIRTHGNGMFFDHKSYLLGVQRTTLPRDYSAILQNRQHLALDHDNTPEPRLLKLLIRHGEDEQCATRMISHPNWACEHEYVVHHPAHQERRYCVVCGRDAHRWPEEDRTILPPTDDVLRYANARIAERTPALEEEIGE